MFDTSPYIIDPSFWIPASLVVGVLILIIMVAVVRLHSRISGVLAFRNHQTAELQSLNEQLQESRVNLENANRELESAVLNANQMAADAEIRNYQLEQEIERRRQSETALRESEAKYRTIIENIEEGYYEVDIESRFTFVNDAICRILNYTREELLRMKSLELFDQSILPDVIQAYERVYYSQQFQSGYCFEIKTRDGSKRTMETSIALMRQPDGTINGFRGIVRDVEERQKYERKLVHLAYHDALTGIHNRKAFYEKLTESLRYAKRYDTEISLIYIDIDHFKSVNDNLGHEAGDALLVEIAKRLKDSIRETDCLCRIGGDEFTIILNNPHQINSEAVANRIIETLSRPYDLDGNTIDFISASLGIGSYPQDAGSLHDLIRVADMAMYRAKEKRNRFLRYGT